MNVQDVLGFRMNFSLQWVQISGFVGLQHPKVMVVEQEVVQGELVPVFSTQQAVSSCPFLKDTVEVIPFAATFHILPYTSICFHILPYFFHTLHRTRLKVHCFLCCYPGTRCKASLMSSEPGALGTVPPCKICAKEDIFWVRQVLLV